MNFPSTAHDPADAIPRVADAPDKAGQPVVLLAFAKLVLMVGVLAIGVPLWLDLVGAALVQSPAPQFWGSLRVAVLGGSAILFTIFVLAIRVWAGLLKHLARAD